MSTEEDEFRASLQDFAANQGSISQEILYLTRDDDQDSACVEDGQITVTDHSKLETLMAKLHTEVQQDCKMRHNLDKKLSESIEACRHGMISKQQVDRICHEVNSKINEYLQLINA